MTEKRKQTENLIYKTMLALDPSKRNYNKYKTIFDSMNDKQFDKYIHEIIDTEEEGFRLDIVEYESPLLMENCVNAAKVLNIDLFEYVYMPHVTNDLTNVVRSPTPALVGYLNIKRPQQLLEKKNGMSSDINKINALTGQVTSDDKNSTLTNVESINLAAMGSKAILQELMGPRSDDRNMKNSMLEQIEETGSAALSDMEKDKTVKPTLSTINAYLLSMGLQTDLLSYDNILPMSLRNNK
jgi:hypothetical protein